MKQRIIVPSSPNQMVCDSVDGGSLFTITADVGSKISYDLESSFKWAPFQKIPNVLKFKITINDYDELFLKHGIQRRIPPVLEFEPYRNAAQIRYARRMILRLRNTTDSRIYWALASVLLKYSITFHMMALSKCFPRYHRELPLHLVMSWVFGSMRIGQEDSTKLDLKRIYILKSNGKKRPLGVPSPVWRIHMSLMNWLLVERFGSLVAPWQHGFMPSRGTLTAWREVLSKVVKAKYIYEFDLKGFFDNVDTSRVLKYLESNGLPERWSRRIQGFKQQPLKVDLGPDTSGDGTLFVNVPPSQTPVPEGQLKPLFPGWFPMKRTTKTAWMWEMASAMKAAKSKKVYGSGFPQGANISPFLSQFQLSLKGFSPGFADLLMYADDGLFYSDSKFTIGQACLWFQELGCQVAGAKSGWVRNEEWVKPLRFLGLEYDGRENQLRSQTRSGKSLLFDKEGLIEDLYEFEGVPYKSGIAEELHTYYVVWSSGGYVSSNFRTKAEAQRLKLTLEAVGGGSASLKISRHSLDGAVLTRSIEVDSTWERVSKSNIFGLIQARLYDGSWTGREVVQSFDYEYISDSWGGCRGSKAASGQILTFANSTSFAFHDISQLLRRSRINKQLKDAWKKGNLSFSYVNKRRASLGFPALTRGMSRSIKSGNMY